MTRVQQFIGLVTGAVLGAELGAKVSWNGETLEKGTKVLRCQVSARGAQFSATYPLVIINESDDPVADLAKRQADEVIERFAGRASS